MNLKKHIIWILALGLLWSAAAMAGPSELPDLPDLSGAPGEGDPSPVRARLIAENHSIEPGSTVMVGLHIQHDEGWHTYWKNGGDSGLPTELEWDLPEGWSASELIWPTPERTVDPGDLITYGYSHDVVLFTRITAPANASGAVTLKARADWLMCLDLCIPGGQDVDTRLEVGGNSGSASTRDQALLRLRAVTLESGVSAQSR